MLLRHVWCVPILAAWFTFPALPPEEVTRKVSFSLLPGQSLEDLAGTGRWEILEVHPDRVVALEQCGGGEDGRTPVIPLETKIRSQDFSVLMENIDQELEGFRLQGNEGKYHTVEEGAAELRAIAAKYPSICHLESLGKTAEGRDLWALRIAGNPGNPDLPRVLLFGLVHAREWISMELPFHIIHQLVQGYGKDKELTRLVDHRVIWILPITNPDGLDFSQKKFRLWRKNRSKTSTSALGVDINRNFEVGWGKGASASPSSDIYRGPSPGSEAETQALTRLMQREKFIVSLSFHSYAELILHPFGHTRDDPPHKDVYTRHSAAMKAINGYRFGPVAQVLYVAGGTTDDTFFTGSGCWSWTFELGKQFVPPESQIGPICRQNWGAVLHLIRAAEELKRRPGPTSSGSRSGTPWYPGT